MTIKAYYLLLQVCGPTSVTAQITAWVSHNSLAGFEGSNPAGVMDVCLLCCMLSGRSTCAGPITVQRSPNECGVSDCDLETSTMRRTRFTSTVEARKTVVCPVMGTKPRKGGTLCQ